MSESDHKEASQPNHAAAGAESGASVDKIRDILFGTQIKNYEARFARLEELFMGLAERMLAAKVSDG